MANVFATAKYILDSKGEISAMKLQKLCYYCQAWSLVWDDSELFPEDFQAWANGPVCPELFFHTQGKFKIVSADEATMVEGELTENQKDTINHVLDHYFQYDAQCLSQLTHQEDPWKLARVGVPAGVGCNNIITKASMAEYYGGLG